MKAEPITAEVLEQLGFEPHELPFPTEFQYFRRWLGGGQVVDAKLYANGTVKLTDRFLSFTGYSNSPADLTRQIEFMNAAEGTRSGAKE